MPAARPAPLAAKIAALEAACATVLQQHTGSSPLSTALPSSAGGAVPGAPPAPALVDELRKLQAQLAVVKRCVDDEAAPLTASQPTEDYGFIGHRRALRFAPQSADMATAIDEYGEKGPYEDEDDEDDEEGEEESEEFDTDEELDGLDSLSMSPDGPPGLRSNRSMTQNSEDIQEEDIARMEGDLDQPGAFA